jgi:hypothetical protein
MRDNVLAAVVPGLGGPVTVLAEFCHAYPIGSPHTDGEDSAVAVVTRAGLGRTS